VDVTSKPFQGDSQALRALVRRYHLGYDANYHFSLLTSAQVEGRCGSPVLEDSNQDLPDTDCPTLPAMRMAYTHVTPYRSDGTAGTADLAGYEGFDERIHAMTSSPGYSLDGYNADLFDINADGLPDVLVTEPGLFKGNHGLFFNGSGGVRDA